jgi:replicative DNA helicase
MHINGGMLAGNFIVLAGRPAMGKSAMALNIAEAVAGRGKPVLYFSSEMTEFELTSRRLAMQSNVSLSNITKGQLEESWDEPGKLVNAANIIAMRPLFIDETPGIMLHELIFKSKTC